jgi:hypothetical protein
LRQPQLSPRLCGRDPIANASLPRVALEGRDQHLPNNPQVRDKDLNLAARQTEIQGI